MAEHAKAWIKGTDAEVHTKLTADVLRARSSEPHGVLGVEPSTDKDALRQRFLVLTKTYHPARFARRPSEVQKLANEHFLLIREAYDKALEAPVVEEKPAKSAVEPAAPPKAAKKRAPMRDAATVRMAPGSTPPGARKPASTAPVAEASRPRISMPAGTDKAAGKAPKRRDSSPTNPAPEMSAASRRALMARRSAEGRAPETIRGRPTTLSSSGKRGADADLHKAFAEAKQVLRAKKFREAAKAFKELAVKADEKTKYRVYMHYALGLEAQEQKDWETSKSEFGRALRLDSAFQPAKKAMQEVAEQSGNRGGLFKKLFGN